MIARLQLMKVHALLAAFILPVAVMFMITGGLYTWGIKGSYTDAVHELRMGEQLRPELAGLTAIARRELAKLGVAAPEGEPTLKRAGEHFLLEWTGSSRDLILEPTSDELIARLTVKETSWYRQFVQLHKAKGGTAFRVYAALFAVALGLLLISGFMMAWQTPRLRRITMMTSGLGLLSFIAVVWAS